MNGSEETYTLTADCYIIPFPEKGTESFIAYFPIQSLVFEVNEDGANILKALRDKPFVTRDTSIKDFLEDLKKLRVINHPAESKPILLVPGYPEPTRTILLLSEKCNLKCLYCYNSAETKGTMMPLRIAKDTIDFIIENAVKQRTGHVELGYHGGGEPTLNWQVLRSSFEYARKKCNNEGLRLHSSICTNGIMPENKINWIIDNINDIAVSADGPPEIQNKQRPYFNGKDSFGKISATLDILNSRKKSYAIRLTATEYSDGRLYEIIRYLIDRFHPPVICIEPLFVCGRCETSGCKPPDEESFVEEMIRVYELGIRTRTNIQYSGNRITVLLSRFCGAPGSNFFITPKGDITACLEISDRQDHRSGFFMYGRYNNLTRKFDFEIDKYRRLSESQVDNLNSCDDCFAKWHCGGDCLAKTPDFTKFSSQRNLYRCKINQTLTRDALIRTMNQQIEFSKNLVVE